MSAGKKFGTFGGVFTPSILTILGVIMYLRLGSVVGNSTGLWMAVGIIVFAHLVSITTGLSVSSVATDKEVKAGGIYYMLSRSLGFPIGGSIGITLFIGTALSISMYLIGFSESCLQVMGFEEITTNEIRVCASLALMGILIPAIFSTSLAIKTQFFILGAIVLSLVSIFAGSSEGVEVGTTEAIGSDFAVLFGIFFPAVTGFTAGVAMSGDLKNPRKAIPWGTMLAIGTGLVVYLSLAIFIYYAFQDSPEVLASNNNALVEFSWIPELVIAGIWGATLSSALGCILGGPRILQAMSIDKITPRIFAKGVGASNEPRNALIVTAIIAQAGILIGDLDAIAPIVGMFFLTAYLFINLSCLLEQLASPDFRPKFKISFYIPLLGTIATLLLMIQLNLVAAIGAILVMGIIFIWLTRKQLVLGAGDVWQSVWSYVVKVGLKNLNRKSTHKRNWEPNILLFSGGTSARPHLINFSKAVAERMGMVSNFDLIETPEAKVLFPKHQQAVDDDDLKDDSIFHRKQECQNVFKGIEAIASTYGFSGVEPNTVLMGWPRKTKDPLWFSQMTAKLHELDYNVLYLDYDKEKGFGRHNTIDIWWKDFNEECDLTLQVAKLMSTSSEWGGAKIRILFLNDINSQRLIVEEAIKSRLDSIRVDAEIQVINNELEKRDFYEVVRVNSFETDLIVLDIPDFDQGGSREFVRETNELLDVMGTTLLVRASSHFYLEEGFDPELEKGYQEAVNLTPKAVLDSEIALGASGDRVVDEEIAAIDGILNELNHSFVNGVYNSFDKVYLNYLEILSEKKESISDMSIDEFHEAHAALIQDMSDNRIPDISEQMSLVLKQHIQALSNFVNARPEIIDRYYKKEELIDGVGDTSEVLRAKKKIRKKGYARIFYKKVVNHHFENNYLFHFRKKLNFVGVSGYIVNNEIKVWVNKSGDDRDLNELKDIYLKRLEKEKNLFLQELHVLGRKLCNSILQDVEKLHVNSISIEREEEHSSGEVKREFIALASYPINWGVNQVYFGNQLFTNIKLHALESRLRPTIQHLEETMKGRFLGLSRACFEEIGGDVASLEVENIESFENKLIRLTNGVKIEDLLRNVMTTFNEVVIDFCPDQKVLAPEVINQFELVQEGLQPISVNVRKVVDHLLENEIISRLKETLQYSFNEGRSETLKIENSLRLIKFTLNGQESDLANLEEVQYRCEEQIKESIGHLLLVEERLKDEFAQVYQSLNEILNEEVVIKRAHRMDGIIRIEKAKKGLDKYFKLSKAYVEKLNNGVDKLIMTTRDALAISGYQYRTKSLQNPHSKVADYVDSVSLKEEVERALPFYYKQLFEGKHMPSNIPLANRSQELSEVERCVQRFRSGRTGAILFTGKPFSGKSYLMNNAAEVYQQNGVVRVSAPFHHQGNIESMIDAAFMGGIGKRGSSMDLLASLSPGTIIVMEDLEYWWTRNDKGQKTLEKLIFLIEYFSGRHLFMLDCSSAFYALVRKTTTLDNNLLGTINVAPLKIDELKSAILERHRSGGILFSWKDTMEGQLRLRQVNKIFKKITASSKGNIGDAFHAWLASIDEISSNILYMSFSGSRDLPDVLLPEWEVMLAQILLHKQIDFQRLCGVYEGVDSSEVNETLQSLLRTGLVKMDSGSFVRINPYVVPDVVTLLRRKQLIE